jgi:hypothetical protein
LVDRTAGQSPASHPAAKPQLKAKRTFGQSQFKL